MARPHDDASKAELLIVDDTLENLRLLSQMLVENGYLVSWMWNLRSKMPLMLRQCQLYPKI